MTISLEAAAQAQLPNCVTETRFDWGPRFSGKVRDTYELSGDRLALVTTDRISAFDHILPAPIPFKGQILNLLAKHAFEETADIIPNHVISVPDPNVTIGHRCEPIPIEFVVRGYLAGHAWRVYREGGRMLCGVPLPDGLREAEMLPAPILTPATKAAEGHDEDVSREEILDRGLLSAEDFDALAQVSLQLYACGTQVAAGRGLILVDTKYEFGRDAEGRLRLIDEVHTPDSSRFYYRDGYDERLAGNQPQRQLSKEFVREWLIENGFQGLEGQRPPDVPDGFRVLVSLRYAELFEAMTGHPFEPETSADPLARIERNVRPTVEE